MQFKQCPKCGKEFDDSWQLCDDCGIKLVVPGSVGASPFIVKIKEKMHSLDMALDSRMGKTVDTVEDARESLDGLRKQATEKATEISKKADEKAQILERKSMDMTRRMKMAGSSEAVMDMVINRPKIILLAVLVMTVIIGASGIPAMLNNISGDMTIYLPQDDPAAIILNEVNEDWSTEMIVIFIQTPNRWDETYGDDYNITNLNVLNEISAIEEAMDPHKDDYGKEDEISFVLSISTLIKEINAVPKQVAEALSVELEIPISTEQIPGDYAIPQDQDEVDNIVSQIPEESRKGLVIDQNGDGVWDSAGIIMGVISDDQESLMEDLYFIIDKFFVDTRAPDGDYNSEGEWWDRVRDEEVFCRMTPTGPVPMTQALTSRTYQEFSIVLPAALGAICVVLIILHRTPKIVIVSGVPILCSLVLTLGLMGLTGWVLSPQVILVAPILLALGVAYGLYIANRYSYERKNVKDKKERMKVAIRTTGKAIFLSAVTTAVGFSSLMFINMVPMRVLGFGLTTGIMICYAVTMLTVPSLIMLLDYEKKGETRSVKKLGNLPVRHRKKIGVFALALFMISISMIFSIQANMNFTEMAPQDEPTVQGMEDYSEDFGGGQMGMVLVRGNPAPVLKDEPTKGRGSMKDIEVLDDIDDLELQLNRITDPPINQPLSVVDVMKMIKIPESAIPDVVNQLPEIIQERINETVSQSFWDAIHLANDDETSLWYIRYGKSMQDSIINIFYNSISIEMRGFLVNQDYSKTLIYIDIPAMDAVQTEKAVDNVNDEVENYPAGKSTSDLTGFAALVVAVNNLLMFNALFSLFMSLIIVFFVLIAIFRSLRFAALTMIPVGLVVALLPFTLVVTGIDLNLVTAMIGSILVGVGIDFGIHMTERIRETGEDFAGIRKSVETSGFTFLEATVTIVAGLLSVMLINIRSIQEFILMVIILLIFSMVAAMLLLPAIYAMLSPEKTETMTYKGEIIEVEPDLGSR